MVASNELVEFVRSRYVPLGNQQQPDKPLRFSIVMPSFKHDQFIERSLLSVLNQNWPATQLIVIDGGSGDGTDAIVGKYQNEIDYYASEPDRGQSDALNKGFDRAEGDIFGWLNSDDLYLPDAFASAAAIFESQPDVDVVYGDWLTVDVEDHVTERFVALNYSRNRLITEGFFCNAQSMFWRRSLHERVGKFDVDLHYTMDYDLMLRMTSIGPGRSGFCKVHRPLGAFREYEGQKTGSANDRVAQEHLHIAKRSGVNWKYKLSGRAMRLYFRVARVVEYLACGRSAYVLGRL